MSSRIVYVGLLLWVLALTAEAQTCQWTGKGGKDVTWVKLMYYQRDNENPPRIIGFTDESKYKRYKGNPELKRHEIDADHLRNWVPEIFGEGGKKADGFYFLSDDAFQPGEEYKDQDEIKLSDGHKFEKGIPCAMFPDKYMGFKKVEEIKDGRVVSEKWYSPIALDILARKKKTDPLVYFGVLLGVVIVCVVLGLVGVRIGDKERAVEEAWDEEPAPAKKKK